ncbi:MAG: hypothetical protein ACLP01_11470 [Solirubrobacteraceae bacterium]
MSVGMSALVIHAPPHVYSACVSNQDRPQCALGTLHRGSTPVLVVGAGSALPTIERLRTNTEV